MIKSKYVQHIASIVNLNNMFLLIITKKKCIIIKAIKNQSIRL